MRAMLQSMPTKAILAVALGVAALAVLIAADVQGWAMSAVSAGMLGSLVGFVPGYLAPSPVARDDAAPRVAAESTTRRLIPPESSDA